MGWFFESLNSSIGKKILMALTGVLLLVFLIIHLAGNLTLYIGKEAFNAYAGTLEIIKPLIRVIEVILGLVFILHIFNGVRLWWQNKVAKSISYAVNASSKNSNIFSRTMILSGTIILIFLLIHLPTFWYPYNFGGEEDLFEIVIHWFKVPWYSILYVIAMGLLGFHLNHGFQSVFQTFGWDHNKYSPLIKLIGELYAFIMAVGFASIPIYFLFFYGGN